MITAYLFNLANDLWAKKWRTEIIWVLKDGPMRFSEIRKHIPHCSVKVLSESLAAMEKVNIVVRQQFHTIPVKVTYHLHPDILPLIPSLKIYILFLAGFVLTRKDHFKLTKEDVRRLEGILHST